MWPRVSKDPSTRCPPRHPESVLCTYDGHVSSSTLDSSVLESTAIGFSALGDTIRLRILAELSDGQRCVCELLESVEIAPNLLSYHLRVLREANLVDASRRGRWVDYSLSEGALHELRSAVPLP